MKHLLKPGIDHNDSRLRVTEALLALLCQQHPIFNAATASQNPFIVGIAVSFVHDICRTELEFWGELRFAGPLGIFLVIVVAFVLATHGLDRV